MPKVQDKAATQDDVPDWLIASRTETERDFDRVLFAAPTRRLGDKTQVFPLEKNESVRTRLTHSHEVSNLARSIGTHLVASPLGEKIAREAAEGDGAWTKSKVMRAIPSMLATVGLAHDLGNPPFGHQGEEAIRTWIQNNESRIFIASPPECEDSPLAADLERLTVQHKKDFLRFEGNAQTLRTLTRLQVVKDNRGLNLTFGTLAALMKYTVPSDYEPSKNGGPSLPSTRKVGFFASEAGLVEHIRETTGLGEGHRRHPLTYIMEACDDIAYLIVDAEDAVKKQIVSFHDMMAWLECQPDLKENTLAKFVLAAGQQGASQARAGKLPPSELNDVAMQIFRAKAITAMVSAVIQTFENSYDEIMTNGLEKPLLELSEASAFAKAMKDFDKQHAYQNRRVLEIELSGFNTIQSLLDMLWYGISARENFEKLGSNRKSPFARYVYGRISENYRRVFEGQVPPPINGAILPIRYRELQLLTDMVSGMTDQFALDLQKELQDFYVGASAKHL